MKRVLFLVAPALSLLAACEEAKAPEPVPTADNYTPPVEGDGGPCGDGSNPKYPEQCK